MSRIKPVDPATAKGKAKDLLDAVQKALGVTPNLFRVVAHSPAALEGLLGLNGALSQGALSAKLREQIALGVAERNGCDYCLSAHSLLGKGAGLADADITQARQGRAADPKTETALRFANGVVERRGQTSDSEIAALRQAGYGDAEIVEIVTVTVLNILTNYLNQVAATEIDFPVVRTKVSAAA
jgi:uncharacterized peroxidase-related enzyme